MSKINSGQLFTLLIGVRMFSIICSAQPSNAEQMAGAALSVLLQLLAVLPMTALYRQDGFSLKKEMLLGRFGKVLYIIFFIVWGALSFSSLWGVTKSVYFPIDSSLAGSFILAAVCVYTASLGLKSVSRYSTIMFGLIIFSLFIMIIGAYPKADLANFAPNAHLSGIINNALKDFCSSGELVMMFILMEFIPSKKTQNVMKFFAGKLILTELVAVIEITVLGKIMDISDFPFFSAGSFSQPFSIQRADSLYMVLFTMLCVMTVTLQIILCSWLIQEILPDLKYSALLSAVLMMGMSWAVNIFNIDLTPVTGLLILVLSVIIPIIMYIKRRYSKNEIKNAPAGNTASADA
ncbi:GerAB/ArcD/ProY family transporter [Porcipelethomonas sp.]|uniref:GerAB/ArcD/ProY family transporter n=1 Tax=Porcipelethomonas sp. TaxID=2981675 RepID=UPI003EFB33BB